MKTPLALLNLWSNKARSAVAMAAVAFSAVLILMQLGFFGTLQNSANRVYNQLDFDVLISSRAYRIFSRPGMFPAEQLALARSVTEVESTAPFWVATTGWLNQHRDPPMQRPILVMAFRPGDSAFKLEEIRSHEMQLASRGRLMMDIASRPEFGPRGPGIISELGTTQVQISNTFLLGSDFSADGAVVTGDSTFFEIFPWFPHNEVSLGLVKLKPGADPDAVAQKLRRLMPANLQVRTHAEATHDEEYFWRTKTSIGTIFFLGAFIALLVGTGIVYQVLSSDISNRLPEFATLKAMGYRSSYLTLTVLVQAVLLAIGGFVPAVIIADMLYALTEREAYLSMNLTPGLAGFVFLLSLGMCVVSAVLSMRKLATADPADLY